MTQTPQELHKAQLELLTAAYSQSKAYFNLVIMGGYAAFFALWALVKDELTSAQTLWSGLFIACSIATFITWEIYQMIVSNRSLLGIAKAVQDPSNFISLINRHNEIEAKRAVDLGRYWAFALIITVGFAVAAASILFYSLVTQLWSTYA